MRLHGFGEDTESMYSDYKSRLVNMLGCGVGFARHEMDLLGYQIHQGITVLLVQHHRKKGGGTCAATSVLGNHPTETLNLACDPSALTSAWPRLDKGSFRKHYGDFSGVFPF